MYGRLTLQVDRPVCWCAGTSRFFDSKFITNERKSHLNSLPLTRRLQTLFRLSFYENSGTLSNHTLLQAFSCRPNWPTRYASLKPYETIVTFLFNRPKHVCISQELGYCKARVLSRKKKRMLISKLISKL